MRRRASSRPSPWACPPPHLSRPLHARHGRRARIRQLARLLGCACRNVSTFVWRASAEEKLLIAIFGERYARYQKQTKMIVPRLLCAPAQGRVWLLDSPRLTETSSRPGQRRRGKRARHEQKRRKDAAQVAHGRRQQRRPRACDNQGSADRPQSVVVGDFVPSRSRPAC
jgi:hypothetical protein